MPTIIMTKDQKAGLEARLGRPLPSRQVGRDFHYHVERLSEAQRAACAALNIRVEE